MNSPRHRLLLAGAVVVVIVLVMAVIYNRRKPEAPHPVKDAVKQATGLEEKERQKRRARQEEARQALDTFAEAQRETVNLAERQRLTAIKEREERERERAAEEARREQERIALERRAAEQRREEERLQAAELEAQRAAELIALHEAEERARREAEKRARRNEEERLAAEAAAKEEQKRPDWDKDGDDTLDVETETTLDEAIDLKKWRVIGDARPIVDALYEWSRDGTTDFDAAPGARIRIGAGFGLAKNLSVGTRLAGTGFVGNFNPNFIGPGGSVDNSELDTGTVTFDQLYLLWQRKERFSLAVGRLQTRFQLRGGVYAKSLDRNNSHNWRVNFTDGLQATITARGWTSNLVLEVNPRSGPTGVRRDPLDFDDDGARYSYFLGFDSRERRGTVVQRAFDISYMPASLLKDGDPDGRRTDYWGFVGRLMFVWPPEKEGLRLRAGIELGYAPETPTNEAMNLPGTGDVSGLAWNVVISAMEFAPGHNIGLNYARTGAGWLISPQYRPNEELIEIRWQWLDWKIPLLETRIRHRTELIQQLGTARSRIQWDLYIRATYRFSLWDR
jgi:hypothetical protein